MTQLPGLDCGECGFESCDAMEKAIASGTADFDGCVVLQAGTVVTLKVNGRDVPVGRFVQGFIKSTTLGMIKTLKKADIKEGDIVELKILVNADDP